MKLVWPKHNSVDGIRFLMQIKLEVLTMVSDLWRCYCLDKQEQSCIALPTAEEKYMSLANTAQEAIGIMLLTTELENTTKERTVYDDNQEAIPITKNPQYHDWLKHIRIIIHVKD